jgi:hypothetical protein
VSSDAGVMESGRARAIGVDIPDEELRRQARASSSCIAAAALEPPGRRPPVGASSPGLGELDPQ